jgi:hypothetical protein
MEGENVLSKGSHFATLIRMCLQQTASYFSPTICCGPENGRLFSYPSCDNNAVTLENTVPCLHDLTTSSPLLTLALKGRQHVPLK